MLSAGAVLMVDRRAGANVMCADASIVRARQSDRPMPELYFEDFAAGQVFELGTHRFERDAIIAFARDFDPQPFHVDETAAAASNFGGLIASGWHTGSVMMRLVVDGLLARTASMGSPGLEALRWLAPVRPGDTLAATLTITAATQSQSRADRGYITTVTELANQDGVVALSVTAQLIIRRRHDG